PQGLAQNHHRWTAGTVFLGQEKSPSHGANAQKGEKRGSGQATGNALRLASSGEVKPGVHIGGYRAEGSALISPGHKLSVAGKRSDPELIQNLLYVDKFLGMRVGQGTKKYRIHNRENGRCGAN